MSRFTLDTEQLAAAHSTARDLVVLAGPGCGKTAVLAERVAWFVGTGQYNPSEIAALTYTRTMAGDLERRINAAAPGGRTCPCCRGDGCGECSGRGEVPVSIDGLLVGTLHSLAANWVRDAMKGEIAGGDDVRAMGWTTSADFGIAAPEDVDDMVSEAYRFYRKKVTKRDLRAGLELRGAELGTQRQAEARRQLRQRGLVTYDDLLEMLAVVVESSATDAPSLRSVVTCLLVDEAHDLTPQHWRIIDAWEPDRLTIVGDDAQRIFSFLVKPEHRNGARGTFGERVTNAKSMAKVGRNYRSAMGVIGFGSDFRNALARAGGCTALSVLTATTEMGTVGVTAVADWAGATVNAVLDALMTNTDPGDIAVIARTWSELREIRERLAAAHIIAATPSKPRDKWSTVIGRAAVAIARHAAKGFLDEHDARTIARALRNADPSDAIERAMREAYASNRSLAETLDGMPEMSAGLGGSWWDAGRAIQSSYGVAALLDLAAVVAGKAMFELADAIRATPDISTREWLIWIASDDVAYERDPDVVCLTTIHGAKGLEWDTVIVVGACEGNLPGPMDRKNEESVLEAGRCLYVAITRARKSLRVICPLELREKPRHPSRWLVDAGLAPPNPAADVGHEEK